MKIVVLLGTMKGKSSYEYKIIKEFLELPYLKGAETVWLEADKLQIEHCHECGLCFEKGVCPFDDIDGMNKFKKQLLWADVILVASPVHAQHVLGIMKDWIDRMWFWSKVLKLAGKGVIVASYEEVDGNEYVLSYLKKAFTYFGCYYIGELALAKEQFDYTKEFTYILNRLIQISNHPQSIQVTAQQISVFEEMRMLYNQESMGIEVQEFVENEMFRFENVKDYFVSKVKKRLC